MLDSHQNYYFNQFIKHPRFPRDMEGISDNGYLKDPHGYYSKEYFLACADLIDKYLALNPDLNGNGRKALTNSINVFRKEDQGESIITWTMLGMDQVNIPQKLWEALFNLGKEPSGDKPRSLDDTL